MTVIVVNGTPLQPAIDAAQPGDTIVPRAGGYAGNVSITKPLTLELGAAQINGPQADGYKNINVTSRSVIVRDGDLAHAGAGIQFNGDCTGSLVQRTRISAVDYMVVNGTKPNTGGMGVAFSKAIGVTLEDLKIHACRARSDQYGWDGADFEFFATRDITIRRCETWDGIYVSEWGRNPTDPLNSNIAFEDCIFHGRPAWQTPAVYSPKESQTYRAGHLIRAAANIAFRRNLFDHLDAWCFALEQSGGYGGPISNVVIEENQARLSSKWISAAASAGIALTEIHSDRNELWPISGQLLVDVNGKQASTKQQIVSTFGWEANSYVGPEPAPVPAPTPDPVPVPDPCADVKQELADATAAVAETNATLVQTQIDLVEANARAADLQKKLDAMPLAPVWLYGAKEGASFTLPTTKPLWLVRYGLPGTWTHLVSKGGAKVTATNATFGDPIVGKVKRAEYVEVPAG